MEENFKQIYAEYEVEERDSIVLEVPDDSTKEEQRLIATPLIHNKYNNATIKEIYLWLENFFTQNFYPITNYYLSLSSKQTKH